MIVYTQLSHYSNTMKDIMHFAVDIYSLKKREVDGNSLSSSLSFKLKIEFKFNKVHV